MANAPALAGNILKVGLTSDVYPRQLSAGQQRAVIARALMNRATTGR
jgi:ABC-type polar amino acid transport system ATPase subunit